jgi:hypothetical protein
MSEENQQQPAPENQPQEVIPETSVKPKKHNLPGKGLLRSLPVEVREDMEKFMREKNSNAAVKYMVDKYGEQFPMLKELSPASFYQYYKQHNVKNSKALAMQLESVAPPREMLNVIDKITDESVRLQDKRAALIALFNACQTRIEILIARQTNFVDPAIEGLIAINVKEQHSLIKTIATLQDQLSKDADKDWLAEARSLVQVILAAVYNAYRLTHSDQSHFSEFAGKVDVSITESLKTYPTSIENLNKNTKKETK